MARREQQAAREHGIPRSIFLGRPLPGPGEPLWLDEDRDWALALQELEADTCSGCGQSRSESTLGQNEYGYTVTPERCHSCAAIRRYDRTFLQAEGVPPSFGDGLFLHVHHD